LVQDFHEQILPGWDIVLIARESCLTAPWPELRQAFRELSQRANLLARMENDYVN
jgi:ribonuclease P protein component